MFWNAVKYIMVCFYSTKPEGGAVPPGPTQIKWSRRFWSKTAANFTSSDVTVITGSSSACWGRSRLSRCKSTQSTSLQVCCCETPVLPRHWEPGRSHLWPVGSQGVYELFIVDRWGSRRQASPVLKHIPVWVGHTSLGFVWLSSTPRPPLTWPVKGLSQPAPDCWRVTIVIGVCADRRCDAADPLVNKQLIKRSFGVKMFPYGFLWGFTRRPGPSAHVLKKSMVLCSISQTHLLLQVFSWNGVFSCKHVGRCVSHTPPMDPWVDDQLQGDKHVGGGRDPGLQTCSSVQLCWTLLCVAEDRP